MYIYIYIYMYASRSPAQIRAVPTAARRDPSGSLRSRSIARDVWNGAGSPSGIIR